MVGRIILRRKYHLHPIENTATFETDSLSPSLSARETKVISAYSFSWQGKLGGEERRGRVRWGSELLHLEADVFYER